MTPTQGTRAEDELAMYRLLWDATAREQGEEFGRGFAAGYLAALARIRERGEGLDLRDRVPCWCKGFTEEGDARGDTIGICDACRHHEHAHVPGGCGRTVKITLQPEAVRSALLALLDEVGEPEPPVTGAAG